MRLAEIIETRRDLDWDHQGISYGAKFELDGITYGISAERNKFEGMPALEVFFYIINSETERDMSLTHIGENQFKVIGIVANGIKEKFSDENIIWFSAKTDVDHDEVQRRFSFYEKLASRLGRANNMFVATGKSGSSYVCVLYKKYSDKDKVFSYFDKEE